MTDTTSDDHDVEEIYERFKQGEQLDEDEFDALRDALGGHPTPFDDTMKQECVR